MPSADSKAAGLTYFSNESEFSDRSALPESEIAECTALMEALRQWHEAERDLAEASRRYMQLNDSDMRTIRLLIRAQRQGLIVTPKDIAAAVGISSASTTKLVDRLVAGGHLIRVPHPHDRRTTSIEVTEETAQAAHESVGRQHARRFDVIAALNSRERETVLRFLSAMTEADRPQGVLADDGSGRSTQDRD